MISSILYGLLVFVVAAIGDVLWTKWSLHANKHHAVRAATWGALIPAAGLVSLNGYLHSYFYIIATGAGCWTGTFFTVRKDKHEGHPGERPVFDGEPVLPSRDA